MADQTNTAAMFIPALTTLLGAGAASADIKAQNRATIANIESAARSLKYSLRAKSQQFEELDRVIGDKLSLSALEQMKAEGRLKAAGAETGVANIEEVITDSYMQENFKVSAILRESDVAKDNIKQSMVADRLGFVSTAESLRSGMRSPLSAGLNVLGAGISGFNTGLSFLSSANQERVLGVDTTGTPNT